MNSKSPLTAIVGRLKQKAVSKPIKFAVAAEEIAYALNIKDEAATMILYGLCATGSVRWLDKRGEVIDEDDWTISDFNDKPKLVIADDVRHWLTEWSSSPQRSRRGAAIEAMLAEGHNPPRNISWKEFCGRVRDECNGWLGDRPALGFSDRQIQRNVKDLRSK
jgi:hypothetical protein